MGGDQGEPGLPNTVAFVRKEDGNPRDQQRLMKPLHDRVHEGGKVGLRVQLAAKLNQRFAIVEALLVEDTIDAILNGPLQRIKHEAGDDNSADEAPLTQVLPAIVDNLSCKCNDARAAVARV